MFDYVWLTNIFAFLLLYVCFPGVLIYLSFFKKINILDAIGSSFSLGFVLFSILTLCGYILNLNISYLHYASILFNLLLLIYIILARDKIKLIYEIPQVFIIILLVAFGGAWISLFSGWYPRGDASVHMQAIIGVFNDEYIKNPSYALIERPLIPDHAFDVYYFLLALISRYSEIEVPIVWHYLSPILSFILPFTLYSFFKSITFNKKIITTLMISFFIFSCYFTNIMNGTVYDALVYPNRVYLWLILPISLAFLIRFLRSHKSIHLVISVLTATSQVFIHQQGIIAYFLIGGGMLLISFLKGRKDDYVMIFNTLLLTFLLAAPFVFIKLKYNKGFIEIASAPMWKEKYNFTFFSENFFSFPTNYYDLASLSISIFFVFLLRTHKYLILVVSSSAIFTFLVRYNPIAVPFLGDIISYVSINRLNRLVFHYVIYGFVFYLMCSFFSRKMNFSSRSFYAFLLTMSMCLVGFSAWGSFKNGDFRHIIRNGMSSDVYTAYETVKDHIDINSVILSDAITSSDIVSFMNVRAVVIQFNGGVDIINIDNERKLVSSIVIDKDKDGGYFNNSLAENLKKFGVDYIIVNKNKFKLAGSISELHEIINSCLIYEDDFYKIIRIKFDAHPC
ncbi:hypothetical protein GCE9029_04596 [Grimontia celer]|uniref:Glycosyltransferase RgtA/B/C/D-like domain-containing protein n=1 Tax=Grimontia celer TaxID=1796497 RepID=A0A128FDD6_9GAMM|nr:hypothetical protein [Grimontia celer]CZF84758.1 hypothetical protein GCE9029_04596 [Grimontia celer]